MPVPPDNRLEPGKIALGRRLFSDPVLSRDDTVSCATCHQPDWINAGSPGLLFLMGAVPTGQPLLFPLALVPVLEDLTFAMQAIALPNVNPSQASNATNVWRGALFR